MKNTDLVKIEAKQLKECYKYIKSLAKLKSPYREERILLEYAVINAMRELLNYSIKEIERDLGYWDFEPKEIIPLTKLCNDGKGNIRLRDFEDINNFTYKIDHYLLAFNNVKKFEIPDIEFTDDIYIKPTNQLIDKWFKSMPKIHKHLADIKPEYIHFILSRLTTFNLIALEPIDCSIDDENFIPPLTDREQALSLLNKKFPNLSEYRFEAKALLNDYEKDYYFEILNYLKELRITKKLNYRILPQICLISALDKFRLDHKVESKSELYSIIDFGLFDNNFNLKFAIEINGPSHSEPERLSRDIKVERILRTANIPLITFDVIDDRNNAKAIARHEIEEKFKCYKDLDKDAEIV